MSARIMSAKVTVSLLVLVASAGCGLAVRTPSPERIAAVRAMEAESAARLMIEGEMLYGADTRKLNGYGYCSLSIGLADSGELRQAIRMASKALYLGQSGGDRCLVALAKRDLANAYSFAGELDRAEAFATQAIQGASSCGGVSNVTTLANKVLGDVLLRRGRAREAVPHYERVLADSPASLKPLLRTSLANAYLAMGDSGRARSLFQESERQANPSLKLLISRGLGQAALAEGKFADASTLFGEAAATVSGPDGAYHRMWALDGLARARLGGGDKVEAADAYRRAMTTAEEVRARFRSDEFKAGFFGDVQQIFDGAVAAFADAGQVEAAFEASERSRARGFQDLVRGRITAKAAAEVLVESSGRPPSLSQIVSHIPEGVVLVEYYISDKRTVAWVIRRSGVRMILLDVGRSILSEEATRFRRLIEARDVDASQLGEVLYAQLIQPLGLRDDEALVVVPHGTLHYLPFQALRGRRGYLVEERPVSYAPSASVLDYLLSNKNGDRLSMLALGNPDLGSPRLSLPGAEREVVQIKVLFPSAEVFIGRDASKVRFVTKAPQSSMVHVGAHADLDEIDPLYSTIRLAGTDGQTGDLEAHEVYGINLSRVGLVTLSACSTGLGKVSRGDELWGFTRTFFAAGVRGVVVSLWAVEDVSTSTLMEKFYGRLREVDVQRALRGAQLDVLQEPKFSHPFYWAAFNLVGAWQ